LPNIGGHSDSLRVLGQFLDEQGGRYATIVEQETFMSVSWQADRGVERTRSYSEFDMEDLRGRARRLRGASSGPPLGEHAELMRTLGQDLDVLGIHLTSIAERDEGYQVTGTRNREHFDRLYTNEVLHRESEERRMMRRAPDAARTNANGSTVANSPGEPATADDGRTPWWRRPPGKI
jgi:hypothetical protein